MECCISIIHLSYKEPVSYVRQLYKINNREYRAIENFKPAFARDCHRVYTSIKINWIDWINEWADNLRRQCNW